MENLTAAAGGQAGTVKGGDAMGTQADDVRWMREALREAALGEGRTRPNPPVGCVIVRGGELIARGHHEYAGGRHAEPIALAALNGDAHGADLYVTLEPCSTHGRTPPCTDAIIKAGVRRVVVAAVDENPKHDARGLQILREAGIEVVTGVCGAESREMLAPFFRYIKTRMPYVVLKMAQSLDGAIADHAGNSKWITCAESRALVRDFRRRADVVLVGRGTAVADNPSLLRLPEHDSGNGAKGMRAVLDATGGIPLTAGIFTDGHADRTIYMTADGAPQARLDAVRATGATAMTVPTEFPEGSQAHPMLSLKDVIARLGALGYMSVLCEGGAALASSLLNTGLVDELALFIAPVVLGAGSKRTFGAYPFDLPTAPWFRLDSVRTVGGDILVRAFPQTGG